jgi:hypothetical protein
MGDGGGREDSGKHLKAGDTSGLETIKLVHTHIYRLRIW